MITCGWRMLLVTLIVMGLTPGQTQARVNEDDVSVSRGNYHKNPKNYERHYYSRTSGYAITPIVIPPVTAQRPIILGPVQPYTDEQYAQIVEESLSVGALQPGSPRRRGLTIVVPNPDPLAPIPYQRTMTSVTDVTDRGVMRLETGEELRLRGLRMMSERERDETRRFYGREAIRVLREMTQGEAVWVELQEPLRNRDGALLGRVFLGDGTELNRHAMLLGLGRLAEEDFTDMAEYTDLAECEEAARMARIGIWSLKNLY